MWDSHGLGWPDLRSSCCCFSLASTPAPPPASPLPLILTSLSWQCSPESRMESRALCGLPGHSLATHHSCVTVSTMGQEPALRWHSWRPYVCVPPSST